MKKRILIALMSIVMMGSTFASETIMAIYLLASTCIVNSLFCWNYIMPIRSEYLSTTGFQCDKGIVMFLIVTVIAYIIGKIKFRSYDIFGEMNI